MAHNDGVKEFLDWCMSPSGDKEIYESITTIRAKFSDAKKSFDEHCGGTAIEKGEPATVFFGGPPHVPLNFKIKCYRCSSKVEQSTIDKTIAAWNKRVD